MHNSLLDIKFPPRSKGGACDKLYEALQAAFRLHWVKGFFSTMQQQSKTDFGDFFHECWLP
jgi:hypothetical protein